LVGVILRVISESRNDTAPAIVNPSAQRGSQMKSASKPLALASAALSEKNRLEMLVSKIVVCRFSISILKSAAFKRRALPKSAFIPASRLTTSSVSSS